MNERVIAQLESELALLKNSEDIEKHVYTMKRLLDLLDDEAVKETTEERTESNPIVSRQIINQQVEDKAGGHGGDIFDF